MTNQKNEPKGASQSKLYNKLDFESLKFRLRFRKLYTFHKIKATGVPEYLFQHSPETNLIYNACSPKKFYNILQQD